MWSLVTIQVVLLKILSTVTKYGIMTLAVLGTISAILAVLLSGPLVAYMLMFYAGMVHAGLGI